MTQEAPQSGGVLVTFRAKTLGKAKGSLEMVAGGNPSTTRVSGPSSAPTDGGIKRKRRDTVFTTRSPHGTLRRPSPPFPIRLETPSLVEPTVATTAPLTLLGRNISFYRGVQVGLTPTNENLLSSVLEEELLSVGIEMQSRGLMLTRLAFDIHNWKVEEISGLEHELAEASNSLKSSLEAVSALLKMDEASSQQLLVCVFDVEKCIVCFELSEDGISGHNTLE